MDNEKDHVKVEQYPMSGELWISIVKKNGKIEIGFHDKTGYLGYVELKRN